MIVGFAYMLRRTLISVLMHPQTFADFWCWSSYDDHEGDSSDKKEGEKHKPEQVPNFTKVHTVLQNC